MNGSFIWAEWQPGKLCFWWISHRPWIQSSLCLSSCRIWPIIGLYSGHVICIDQWELSISEFTVLVKYWPCSEYFIKGLCCTLHTGSKHWYCLKSKFGLNSITFSNHLNTWLSISQQNIVFYALSVLQCKLRELRERWECWKRSDEGTDGHRLPLFELLKSWQIQKDVCQTKNIAKTLSKCVSFSNQHVEIGSGEISFNSFPPPPAQQCNQRPHITHLFQG